MESDTINSTDKTVESAARTEEKSLLDDRSGTAATVTNTESVQETNFQKLLKSKWWLFCLIVVLLIGGTLVGISFYFARETTASAASNDMAPTIWLPKWFEPRHPRLPSEMTTEIAIKDAVLMLNKHWDEYNYQNVSMVIRLNGDSTSARWTRYSLIYLSSDDFLHKMELNGESPYFFIQTT